MRHILMDVRENVDIYFRIKSEIKIKCENSDEEM